MRKVLLVICFFISAKSFAQLLTWSPAFPKETDAGVTITMDANYGNKALLGFAGDVFVHIGCLTNTTTGATPWQFVKSTWGTSDINFRAQPLGSNKWSFTLTGASMRAYFGVTNPAEFIRKIAILFRNGSGSVVQRNADGSDMYVPVYSAGLQVAITNPFRQPTYNPTPENITKSVGQTVDLTARSSENATLRLLFNGTQVNSQAGTTTISASPTIAAAGSQRIIAEADNGSTVRRDTLDFYIAPNTEIAALPPGVTDGINYNPNGTEVTLVLYAPIKTTLLL